MSAIVLKFSAVTSVSSISMSNSSSRNATSCIKAIESRMPSSSGASFVERGVGIEHDLFLDEPGDLVGNVHVFLLLLAAVWFVVRSADRSSQAARSGSPRSTISRIADARSRKQCRRDVWIDLRDVGHGQLPHVPEEQESAVPFLEEAHPSAELCPDVDRREEPWWDPVGEPPAGAPHRADLHHGRGGRLPPVRVGEQRADDLVRRLKHTPHPT